MIETSEHSVNQPFRTVEAPNPPYGVPPPDVDPRPLRIPPPAAHPPSSRYSGQIRSPSHGSGDLREIQRRRQLAIRPCHPTAYPLNAQALPTLARRVSLETKVMM